MADSPHTLICLVLISIYPRNLLYIRGYTFFTNLPLCFLSSPRSNIFNYLLKSLFIFIFKLKKKLPLKILYIAITFINLINLSSYIDLIIRLKKVLELIIRA